MQKPYIICHMMTSLDGRIDCTMTSKVDLVKAANILSEQFNVERMGIVGGPKINTAFLEI